MLHDLFVVFKYETPNFWSLEHSKEMEIAGN